MVFLQGPEQGCYSEVPSPGTAPHLYQGFFVFAGHLLCGSGGLGPTESKASTMGGMAEAIEPGGDRGDGSRVRMVNATQALTFRETCF
jgi:hypothetical protein